MADRELVLCAPLCFLIKRYDKLERKLLKSVLIEFFKPGDITAAKSLLENDVSSVATKEGISSSAVPRFTRRVNNENRMVNEVDDIIKLIDFVDENRIVDLLPKYVAESPDDMPYMRIVDSDFKFLISKINTLEAMLNGLYAINGELRSQLTAQFNATRPIDVRSGVINNSGQTTTTTTGDSVGMGKPAVSHSSAQRQQPQGNVPSESSAYVLTASASRASTSNDRNTDTNVDQSDGWTVVASKSKKRRIQSGGQGARARTTETTDTTDTDTNSVETKQKQKQKKNKPMNLGSKSKRVMVGTKQLDWPVVGTVDQSIVAAAKPYLRKSVFCVDNVKTDVTASDMEKFVVDSLNVKVISCFQVKPRRAKWQKEAGIVPTDRNTFRLCIDRDDERNFLNEEIWPQKIAIYRWAFKDRNQDNNQDRNDDRDATVIALCSSRPQSDGGLQPTGQSTPSTSHAAALSLTSTGSCQAAAADVDNDVIPLDARWADAVDMDASDATVILNYNDDAEL